MRSIAIVGRCIMNDPGDVEPLKKWWIDHGKPKIHAVLGKTEGNGCVNDFSRGYATLAIKGVIGAENPHVSVVISGGTEGVLSPHYIILAEKEDTPLASSVSQDKFLSIGVSRTRPFAPEEIGTVVQAQETARAVQFASKAAGLAPHELKFAQVKCPLLTSERLSSNCITQDTYESMAFSRSASAVGVGMATGEIDQDDKDLNYGPHGGCASIIASTSAGVELLHSEIVVLGNGATSGQFRAANGVMKDSLDLPSIVRCLTEKCKLPVIDGQLAQPQRIAAFLCKADTAAQIRGYRTTQYTDSDINATRHSRAAVGGLVSGLFADTRLFVSGGAERQGPDGGGPFLILYS